MDKYPNNIRKATGGLIGEKYPLICGGALTDACHVIGKGNQVVAQLMEQKYEASSLVIGGGSALWVTGGYNLDHRVQTTEIVELNQSGDFGVVRQGPQLPKALFGHSMVLINESLAMVIGGSTNIAIGNTYFYNFDSKSWSNGPGLSKDRSHHDSAMITDKGTGKQYVVVAGGTGVGHDGDLDSVEFLDVSSPIAWRVGPKMPKALTLHKMVSLNDSVVVIGGFDGFSYQSAIYELTCSRLNCQWETLSQSLEHARTNFVAMLIPDQVANCK